MTRQLRNRREVLKTAAAVAAAASLGSVATRAAEAPKGRVAHDQIDALLHQAAEAKQVPGVVAVAATDKGVLYEVPSANVISPPARR
jgi:hypothetical protein